MIFDLQHALDNATTFLPEISTIETDAFGDVSVIGFGLEQKDEIEEEAITLAIKQPTPEMAAKKLKKSLLYSAVYYGLCTETEPAYLKNTKVMHRALISNGLAKDMDAYRMLGEAILEKENMLTLYYSFDVAEVIEPEVEGEISQDSLDNETNNYELEA